MKKLLMLMLLVLGLRVSTPVHAKKINMGEFKLTAYCPCDECSEGWGRSTASGKRARSSHTVAVDPNVISYGRKLKVGNKTYVAEDCGGGVRGDHIDIFFDTHEEVEEFGVKYKKVWIIK